jgi:orotate phosphoribosyltransferase
MQPNQSTGAELLTRIKAPHFYSEKPFVFTSGTNSPVYVDCRKLISYPSERRIAVALAADIISGIYGKQLGNLFIAGGETAGIPFGAWIAAELNLPFSYVRKAPKGFGRLAQIEGDVPKGSTVVLIEDLMFDAKSKINFCKALRDAEIIVEHCVVVFNYGIPASQVKLNAENLSVHSLATWETLLPTLESQHYFDARQSSVVRQFLENPIQWSNDHAPAVTS